MKRLLVSLGLFCPLFTSAVRAVPAPTDVQVFQDHRLARLSWNGWPKWPTANPPGVFGYEIRWGEAGGPLDRVELQGEAVANIEPLEPGKLYEAEIRAIDAFGRTSPPTPRVQFRQDGSRLAALRARMTGFFDAFDLPEGAPDERLWNTAWSIANDPDHNGFWVTHESHPHTTVASGVHDRAQVVSRPRTPFDFRGRTGEIVFDFDMVGRRNTWYLDITPRLVDITSHVHLGFGRGFPGDMLRYRQDNDSVDIRWVDANGNEQVLANSGWSLITHGVRLAPHVRQNWSIRLSRTWTGIYVNGKLVAQANLDLGWEVGWVHFTLFSYNTIKANMPRVMVDWGLFGFDGPPPSLPSFRPGLRPDRLVTHNYVTNPADGREAVMSVNFAPRPVTIRIPDSLQGALAARLMFTLQTWNNQGYQWHPNDSVTLNGTVLPIPEPRGSGLTGSQLVNGIMPYSVVIPVSPSLLRTGENSLLFATRASGFLNIHIEIDFPSRSAPAYTQPADVYGMPVRPIPPRIPVGPSVIIEAVNGNRVWPILRGPYRGPNSPTLPVSGIIEVEVLANEQICAMATGHYVGLRELEVWMENTLVQRIRTDLQSPTPGGRYFVTLDTRLFPNGVNRLFIRGLNAQGTPSIPDYFEANARTGDYYPLHLDIRN